MKTRLTFIPAGPFRIRILLTLMIPFLALISGRVLAQGKIARRVSELRQKGSFTRTINPFTVVPNPPGSMISRAVSQSTLLMLNQNISEILSSKPDFLEMNVPIENGTRQLKVQLFKVDISPNGLNLITSDGQRVTNDSHIVNYRGSLSNDNRSVAAFTFSDNEVMGMISNDEGNYVLGKLENDNTGRHIIYKDNDLLKKLQFECGTNTSSTAINHNESATSANREDAVASTKCVQWYWETDYDIFVNKGGLAGANTYIQGIFNQVSTLYANDGLTITLKTLFVWTSVDPYTGPTTSDYLNQFGDYRTSFDGDLANLIGFAGSGGIAWIGGFCTTARYQMAYSGISSGYNNVPTYSWTVEVLAHEEGHLFGSRHTHDCAWNGNNTRVDSCGDYAGYSSCAAPPPPIRLPVGGGTIMSYCHLTTAGINFNLGFGPQPLNVMSTGVSSASCLSTCSGCTLPAQPGAISGNTTSCSAASQTYSVGAVSGATSYTWTIPAGWTGSSTSNSITTTAGTSGGTISVKANNACGSGPTQSISVSITSIPAQPGAITGSASVCASTSVTYSISAVSGATSYTWTIPAGWSGSSTTNSITLTSGASGGTITVKSNNSCGSSAVQTLSVSIAAIPAQPGAISGSPSVCSGISATYSITSVAGATSYTWTLPGGWTGSSTTNSITTTTGVGSGTITVKANNSCGSGPIQSLVVAVTSIPSQPGIITGPGSICANGSGTYSIVGVGGATGYTWTLPVGWTGSSTTNSITATAGVLGGTISVTANNSCGNSIAQTLAIIVNLLPAQPGIISGSNAVCPNSSTTYSIVSIAGATSYNWTIPAGWTGSSTTNSITVTTGGSGGNILVSASNSCGTSASQTLAVSINSIAPSQPGVISGSSTVCPNSSTTYSVSAVSGATSYNWSLPAGWTGSSTTNSITVTANSSGGTLSVSASNSCGTSPVRTLVISIGSAAPSQPGVITGSSSVCPNSSSTYSIASVSGATSYNWSLPAGWTGSSTTNSITVTSSSNGGNILVSASNSCGTSTSQTLAVAVNSSSPSQPGSITGSSSVCPNSSLTYSVAVVSGATSYNWTLPAGWTGSSTTNSITVTSSSNGGNILVSASNSCGTSTSQTLAVSVNSSGPSQPGAISGSSTLCPNSSATYSIAAVSGAISYNWSLPAGWSGSSTTNSITVTATSNGGNISVSASNACGTSASSSIAISISSTAPAQPSPIAGPSLVCSGSTQTYSVNPVAGATQYYWSIPNYWSGFSLSNSISVLFGSSGGNISVSAANDCATSPSQTLAITLSASAPAQPGSIAGNVTVCPNSTTTYSIASVNGAASYNWTLPVGWTGSSSTNSITVTTNGIGGTVTVSASNSCGTSTSQTLNVTIGSAGPSQPGVISGNNSICPNSSNTYSVASVSGASSYNWTLPAGWTGSSTTNSITTTAGSSGGTISVSASNSCGTSTSQTLIVSVGSAAPSQPGAISGNNTICPNSSNTYSVASVSGASSYNWTLPAGWTGSSTTNSITSTAGSLGGTISVSASNSCGTSSSQTLIVTVGSAAPSQPGVISGNNTICPNSSNTYSVASVSGASSYNWTLPAGWTGSSTTNSITVTAGGSGGTISVSASNSCGTSSANTLVVTVGASSPSQPGAISGNNSICPNIVSTYSIASVNGATSYNWTLPAGWTGSSSTNSITVTAGSSGGSISVSASNGCGTSASQSLVVTVGAASPSQPGIISGNATVCSNNTETYSVTAVSGATDYSWTLPAGWSGSSAVNSITVTTGSSGGTISVSANNSCGSSGASTLPVSINGSGATQPGPISGSAAICQNTVQTYSVNAVPGASGYTWTIPSGWSGSSTTNSITVTAGTSNGTIAVSANGSCGTSAAQTLAVSVSGPVTTPGAITASGGTPNACPGDTRVYTTTLVAGNSYTWTAPTGAIILSGQGTNSITVSFNSSFTSSGVLSVKATNPCGTSGSRTLTIARNIPSSPGAITESGGNVKVCPGDTRTYSVNPNPDVSFAWTVPTGASISSGQGTNSILVAFDDGFTSSGTIRVTANNTCGSGNSSSVAVSRNVPGTPGTISVTGGSAKVCPGDTRTYSVVLVADVDYTWTAPTGGNIISGQGTNSVVISFDNNFVATGIVKVTASNNCGTSTPRTLNILQNIPATPGTISGSLNVTCNSTITYSITAVSGATSYIWTIPAGASIIGLQNGNSINVLWGTTGGAITVKASNSCGISAARSVTITLTCAAPLEGMVAPKMNAIIYPNPTEGNFALRFYSTDDAQFQVVITDISGRVLRSENVQAAEGINERHYDLRQFAQGIYLLRLKKGDLIQVFKIIKE